MSQLGDYLIGQVQQRMHSLESGLDRLERGQDETHSRLDQITKKLDEALSWAQRLVLLGLSMLGAIGLNWRPELVAEALASFLKALR